MGGERLDRKQLRKNAGLTVEQAADALGVKAWTIYKIESGWEPVAKIGFFEKMIKVYGCSFEELANAYRAAR